MTRQTVLPSAWGSCRPQTAVHMRRQRDVQASAAPYNRPSNRKGLNARSPVVAAGRAPTTCLLTSSGRLFTEDKHTGPLGEVQSGSDDSGSFVVRAERAEQKHTTDLAKRQVAESRTTTSAYTSRVASYPGLPKSFSCSSALTSSMVEKKRTRGDDVHEPAHRSRLPDGSCWCPGSPTGMMLCAESMKPH
jgi:hypothetical protein